MKVRFWILTSALCLAVWALAACNREEPAVQNEPAQQQTEQPSAAQQQTAASSAELNAQVTSGQLQAVDLQAKTLTVTDAVGNQQTFWFANSTDVTGADSTQGLSNQQGSQVMVHWVEQDGRNMAVRIEIIPR
jgi:hypothetical protein